MKLTVWTMGLLSLSSWIAANGLISPATAQCIQADISIQYNISGSQVPTERINDVKMTDNGACQGNATVTTGIQGNVGGNGRVRQSRVVRHRLNNHNQRGQEHNHSGGSTIQIQSNPAIDVYNPADNLDY